MPQMKPMYWLFLSIYFMIMYMLINISMYFMDVKKMNMINNKVNKFMMYNFKW
uniref:ATP synthase F0 subunit 8 n=1 Tax=Melanips sp. ZJUH 20220003 TaxID=2943452 RepID=A0A9E8GAV4_9HYME|nr:ATP synthase F0 subunit 8 [Melanips sp. ZJUH 20220003]